MKSASPAALHAAEAVPAGPVDKRALLRQWITLAIILLIIGSVLASTLYEDRRSQLAAAEERLTLDAKSVAFSTERHLFAVHAALSDLRNNLPYLKSLDNGNAAIRLHMMSLTRAVDSLRTLALFDAKGYPTVSNRNELTGMNFSHREYFQFFLNNPRSQALHVTKPYTTALGTFTISLTLPIIDDQGEFSGLITASLEPEAFKPMLAALRYSTDVSAGLVHGSGSVLLYLSTPDVPPGTDVSDPASFFSLHMKSGKAFSRATGFSPILHGERVAAMHTVDPAGLSMSAPLVVVLSQEIDSILAPWYDDLRNQLGLFALLTVLSALALGVTQNRQRRLAIQELQHQASRQHDIDRLKLATEASGTGIWELDLKTMALSWDETMFRVYGMDRADFSSVYDAWRNCVLPEDLPATEAEQQRCIETGAELDTLFRIRRGDGEIRIIDTRAWVYKDEAGKPVRLIGVNRDITQRQQLEQSLRESKDFATGILHSLMQHIAVLDEHGSILAVNQAWEDFARDNCTPGQPLISVGMNYLDICSAAPAYDFGAEALAVRDGIRRVLDGTQTEFSLEYPCHSPDKERWFIMHVTPLCGANRGAVVAHENITLRKQAEAALKNAQQVTQQFLDQLPGTAYVKDENLRVVMANKTFQTLLGLDPATMIGKSNSELFPGNFGKKLDDDDRRVLESGYSTTIEEDFEGRFFESNKFVIEGETGKRLLGGITMEVTQRHKFFARQDALIRISELGGTLPEEDFLRQGLEMIEHLTLSQIGFIHFVNEDQESIELVTWTKGALKGCTAVHEMHYPIKSAGIWADCAREKKISVFNDYPAYKAKMGLPEGHAPLQRLISVPVIEEGKVRVILGVGNKSSDYDDFDCATAQVIGNDMWRIVHRVRAENALKQKLDELSTLNAKLDETNNRLLQSEKLAALGQLAAGVAHEINNPIGYVSSNLNSLRGYIDDLLAINAAYGDAERQLSPSMPQAFKRARQAMIDADYDFIVSDVQQLLSQSNEGLARVRKIVQDLKDFSRVGATGWQWANLHEGLESTLNIVWNEIKYKAEVERDYGDLPDVHCIPSQINQVFLNLLTNAAQAIEGHGQIILRSRHEGENVWIEVQDTGAGIAPENLDKLFEPFFTTKPVGQGTGLGLSLSWSIIQRHHGMIEARSNFGQGTTFRVTLPIDPHPKSETSEINNEIAS